MIFWNIRSFSFDSVPLAALHEHPKRGDYQFSVRVWGENLR
jgi:hypothetical protein